MPTDIKEEERNLVWSSKIDRIHRIDGGWPIPQFRIPVKILQEITAGCDRIALVSKRKSATDILHHRIFLRKIIPGGIPVPHLHLGDEIVLFDKPALQKYLQVAAEEVAKIDDITDIGEFIRF